ncbi:MAG: hypothetical protein QOE35_548 [Actinomycetota bacterium]
MASTLLEELPPAYAIAILLEAGGVGPEDMATRLEIPVQSVPTLLQVARHKLASLLALAADDGVNA